MMTRDWVGQKLTREATLEASGPVDMNGRTVELAFSSESPVDRWFGIEVLSHDEKAINLQALRDGAPLLLQHDPGAQIGVVERAEVGRDRVARATVRFSRSARAQEILQDVADGIRRKVSVGYMIEDGVESKRDGREVFTATRWTPLEISIVSVPADFSVGVGRAHPAESGKEANMAEQQTPAPGVDETKVRAEERAKESKRIADLMTCAREYAHLGGRELVEDMLTDQSKTVGDLREAIMRKWQKDNPPVPVAEPGKPAFGSGARERLRYDPKSIAIFKGDEEAAYRAGQWARAVIFADAGAHRWCADHGIQLRVMTEGTNTAGGYLVPAEMERSVIDLRATYGVARRLARMVPMGSDVVSVPKRTAGVTAYFTGENTATPESDMTWGNVDLVAKELSALTRISMSLAEDSVIDLAAWVADEQAYAFAVKEDNCLFIGDGTSTYGGMTGLITLFEDGNHTAGAVDAATNNDTFAEITANDLAGVMAKLPSYARNGAVWVASPTGDALMFGRLMAAGGGNTISDMRGNVETMYLGYRRVLAEPMPAGSATDYSNKVMALYGNFAQGVLMGERRGVTVQVLRERYAEYRQIGIIASERVDIVVHGAGDTSTAGPVVALMGE